jgi:hypothetical protein
MAYQTGEILALIARQPGMRDVEIADAIDLDVDLVHTAIRTEIDAGIVIVLAVKAPNGRTAHCYAIAAGHVADYVQKPGKARRPRSSTKIQRALEFIRSNGGKATNRELQLAAGLQPHQYPAAYLKHAVIDGRLAKHGRFWRIGTGKPATPMAMTTREAV